MSAYLFVVADWQGVAHCGCFGHVDPGTLAGVVSHNTALALLAVTHLAFSRASHEGTARRRGSVDT